MVVASMCIQKEVELWVTFGRRSLQVMVVMLSAGQDREGGALGMGLLFEHVVRGGVHHKHN